MTYLADVAYDSSNLSFPMLTIQFLVIFWPVRPMSIGEKLPRFSVKLKANDCLWSLIGLVLKIIQDLCIYVNEDPRRLEREKKTSDIIENVIATIFHLRTCISMYF